MSVDVPDSDELETVPSDLTASELSQSSSFGGGASPFDKAVRSFQDSLSRGQGPRLARAYPTFKLYFIESDGDSALERERYGFDDFFSYSAVSSIRCIRSRKICADLCVIELTNISGLLSNRKFRYRKDSRDRGPHQASSLERMGPQSRQNHSVQERAEDISARLVRDTAEENPIFSLMLKEGTHVQLRLGYSNDPEKLSTVFNGQIVEVEFSDSDDRINITCQSFATELVQHTKGIVGAIEKSEGLLSVWSSPGRTDELLEWCMSEPEVKHFGRWERADAERLAGRDPQSFRSALTNRYTRVPRPQDDNIFAPPIEILNTSEEGWIFDDIKYYIYQFRY